MDDVGMNQLESIIAGSFYVVSYVSLGELIEGWAEFQPFDFMNAAFSSQDHHSAFPRPVIDQHDAVVRQVQGVDHLFEWDDMSGTIKGGVFFIDQEIFDNVQIQ